MRDSSASVMRYSNYVRCSCAVCFREQATWPTARSNSWSAHKAFWNIRFSCSIQGVWDLDVQCALGNKLGNTGAKTLSPALPVPLKHVVLAWWLNLLGDSDKLGLSAFAPSLPSLLAAAHNMSICHSPHQNSNTVHTITNICCSTPTLLSWCQHILNDTNISVAGFLCTAGWYLRSHEDFNVGCLNFWHWSMTAGKTAPPYASYWAKLSFPQPQSPWSMTQSAKNHTPCMDSSFR